MRGLSALFLVAAAAGSTLAFAPTNPAGRPSTHLHPKFLKDLGFEKPSWLPEFGKKDEEAPAKEEATEEGVEGEEDVAAKEE
jgi:hypothetical protein|tara:strand:+ start:196 stop:441 length:246 start_codon:yes stop_codon:yes gene_type:complete